MERIGHQQGARCKATYCLWAAPAILTNMETSKTVSIKSHSARTTPSITGAFNSGKDCRPLPRCEHGVYVCSGSPLGKSLYCSFCTPLGPYDTKDVVLPRSSGDPLTTAGRLLANRGGCPKCGSTLWLRQKETGSDLARTCADCGALYKRATRTI